MKTSELTGADLDWAVAKCEGLTEDTLHWCLYEGEIVSIGADITFSPTTNWAQGGPIIDREGITLKSPSNQLTMNWEASIGHNKFTQWDHAPLIAAMRCYVASKLGDEVEIPEELK